MTKSSAVSEVNGPAFDLDSITGIDKAAILLLSLSEGDAAAILKHLEPKQVQQVGMAMASIEDFGQEKVIAVHRLFLDDIQKYSSIGFNSEENSLSIL